MREIIGTDGIQMRKRILKKLNSRRGASLTFALLLFLVCAAVGSVVLTAATATAGRASGNYEYDQRYYAVMSAADLLRDTLELDDQTVTILFQRECDVTQRTPYTRSGDDFVRGEPGDKVETSDTQSFALQISDSEGRFVNWLSTTDPVSSVGDSNVSDDDRGLLRLAALSLVSGKTLNEGLFRSAAWLQPDLANAAVPDELTLTIPGHTELDVTVTPELQSDGSLTLQLENASGTDKFKLTMTLAVTVRESSSSVDSYVGAEENLTGDNPNRVESFRRTEQHTATVIWRVTDVRKAM